MRRQSVRVLVAGAVGVLLAAALLVMVNYLGARTWKKGDWTSSKVYSLSDRSRNLLAQLEEEIRVVVFMTPTSALFEQARELLDRYASASDKVKVELIDPDREPLKTRQLAEQYGVSVANTVVFVYGDRTKYVTSDQMADYDYGGMQLGGAPTLQAFKGEEQFTAAILSLVAPRVPAVYFVTGHGEATPGGAGNLDRSLEALAEALRRDNMTVSDTSLLGGALPEDADALAIVGPTKPFAEHEVELLDRFLAGGGRLLVALDPLFDPAGGMRSTRLEPFLERHGVAVHDSLVVDPSRRLPFFDLSSVYLDRFTSHPVTQGLEGVAVLLPVTRSLAPVEREGLASQRLVETTAEGWGETNLDQLLRGEPVALDEGDIPGPVAVAVAVETDEPGPGEEDEDLPGEAARRGARLLVFGDSDFLTDDTIGNAGNLTLALNAFNWLVQREEALGIPPRPVERVSLFLSRQQLTLVFLLCVVAMPAAAIVVGVVVWRRRRH